jgi:hypothetical protein
MPQTVPNRPTKGAVEPTVASRPMRICSSSLVTMTYQLPIDMTARMNSTALATRSLCAQSAPTP